MRPNPSVVKMHEGIEKMTNLVASSGEPISEQALRDLSVLCDGLLATIAGESRKR
jgi:hypothetical protein